MDRRKRITPNFEWREFLRPDERDPSPDILKNIELLANRLQVVRDLLGKPIKITSGYRTPEHNRAIGGSTGSYHLTGQAADIQVPGMTPKQVADFLAGWSGGLGLYTAHVHVDARMTRARWNG